MMQRLLSWFRLTIASLVGAIVVFGLIATPAWADAPSGQQLFNANCSACHIGGNNVIISHKTLKKEALEKYEMASIEAIRHQVINGKNAMPAFGERLSEEEIGAIANYVLSQAETGWTSTRAETTGGGQT